MISFGILLYLFSILNKMEHSKTVEKLTTMDKDENIRD